MNQTLLNSAEAIRAPADFFGPIALDLEEVEHILASTLGSRRACVVELVGHLNRYRGKRLRPTLVLLACESAGGIVEEGLPAACAAQHRGHASPFLAACAFLVALLS